MGKLILIEFIKISKKKSVLFIMVLMLIFNLLNNILFYTDYDNDGNYKYLDKENIEEEKSLLEEELLKYDIDNKNDLALIVNIKTKLDVIKLKENYDINSWQYNKVSDYLYNILESINVYTYQIKDEVMFSNLKKELEIKLLKFESNDWKYFVNIEKNNLENELDELYKRLEVTSDISLKNEINEMLEIKKESIKVLEYRLSNDVTYDNSYLNITLNNYMEIVNNIKYYDNKKNQLTLKEEAKYQNLKEELEIDKYILENKENYNKYNNLNYQLRTIVDDYLVFIIIIVLIISSTIVAEEFINGTIKLLLIKPYSRVKILLSKYFTTIIFLFFIILYLVLLQIVIGGYIFGFSSLEIPVIVYDFNKMCIVEYNIFIYMIIRIITKLPMIIMLITVSFCFSTILNNVVISIVMPLFIYIFTPSISYLIINYNINLLKYLVNINWDFTNYLFGRKVEISGLNIRFSLGIWCIYFITIVIFSFINFKKKDIKNI